MTELNWKTHYLSLLACLMVPLLVGCGFDNDGPIRAAVSGNVTFDGKPIENGVIEFIPNRQTAGPSAGARIENGYYDVPRAKGPVVGSYLVRISSKGPTGRRVSQGSQGVAGETVAEIGELIPANFNQKTTLEREIEAKQNVFDFDLESE
ncbi:hypothetical protein AB1K70_25450 [Bremerella sp. JC770]|uniref:hypothetical protein n=1 Tax=Bremerella sp. JC770 TaxID=3232137 RepID=UPI00345969E4